MNSKLLKRYTNELITTLNLIAPKDKKNPLVRAAALVLMAEGVVRINETIKAFGGCEYCYGKGYGTQTVYATSRRSRKQMPIMRFCECARGKALMKLWHDGEEAIVRALTGKKKV